MADVLLEVVNLKKYFKAGSGWLHAVDDVSFSLDKGETLGVVGESGCGKTTLGRSIVRLLQPTSGKIIFEGKDINEMSNKEFKNSRTKMQIIFQDPFSSLNPKMTVQEIIAEPLRIFHCYNPGSDRRHKIEQLMETVGLTSRLARSYPHELDGGRRQRVGIARALALNPKFIVCDEPVSALDISIQAQILNLLQDLQLETDVAYLFITHDLSVVRHISDNIIVMYLGVTVEYCEAKALFHNPMHPYTKALLSAIPIPDPAARKDRVILEGEIYSPIDPPEGCRFVKRCPKRVERCFVETPVLTAIDGNHCVACHLYT